MKGLASYRFRLTNFDEMIICLINSISLVYLAKIRIRADPTLLLIFLARYIHFRIKTVINV